MALIAKASASTPVPPMEDGTYPAALVGVIDLGTQRHEYLGKVGYRRDVALIFEILGETIPGPDGQAAPRTLKKDMTLSLGDKATLTKYVKALMGRALTSAEMMDGIDITSLIGRTCMISTEQSPAKTGDRVYTNISGILPPSKALSYPAPQTAPMRFVIGTDGDDAYAALPEYYRKTIAESKEYKDAHQASDAVDFEVNEETGEVIEPGDTKAPY